MIWSLLLLLVLGAARAEETRASLAWFGEPGLNPGLKGALERRTSPLTRPHTQLHLFAGPALGTTLHPQSHVRTLLAAEAGVGVTAWGVDVELRLSGGGGRTFLASPTYTLSDDGETLQRVPLAGQWGWMPSASLGLGSALRHPDRRWFLRGGLMAQVPYHDTWAPLVLLELGASMRLGTR